MAQLEHEDASNTMASDCSVALVTGANKGIGLEVARQLGEMGWLVLVCARDPQRGIAATDMLKAQGIQARFEQLDITDDSSIDAAALRIAADPARLDVLINNAGVLFEGDFPRPGLPQDTFPSKPSVTSRAIVRSTYAANVFGAIAMTNAMLPLMRRSKAARIVNVSSKLASLSLADDFCQGNSNERYFNLLAYNSSKAALNAATLQYAIELRNTTIKVNAVDPGHCATDINGHIGDRPPSEAAKVIVRLATLPHDGPTGAFIGETGRRAW